MHAPDAPPLLQVQALSRRYRVGSAWWPGARREVHAVDGVSFDLQRGETLGLVGESGCGKSTLARCVVRLNDPSGGTLRFEGRDITRLSARELRPLRPRLQLVFQDPSTALNPRRRVADLLAEPLRLHGVPPPADAPAGSAPRRDAAALRERVLALAGLVGLRAEQLERYPHEFSGGQRQRIGIARALALNPSLLVLDEPVSALDVSIQAQIVNLLADLQERLGLAYLFIAHDLSVVRQVSTRTAVMYLGGLVEVGPTDAVYAAPAHPYTRALLGSVPRPRVRAPSSTRQQDRQVPLAGDPPSPLDPPAGCRFHPRCPQAQARCRDERSLLAPLPGDAGRSVACHFPIAPTLPHAAVGTAVRGADLP